MGPYFFGLHIGHLRARADRIAARHGASHVNYTEPGGGQRRGWFECKNRGAPFDRNTAVAVMADIEHAGGIAALTKTDAQKGA